MQLLLNAFCGRSHGVYQVVVGVSTMAPNDIVNVTLSQAPFSCLGHMLMQSP